MASSSKHSSSPVRTLSSDYDSDGASMPDMKRYGGMSSENLEKSLTNLNVNIALLAAQREEMDRNVKEFNANFIKQQEIIGEEIKQLRVEMFKLRQSTRRGA